MFKECNGVDLPRPFPRMSYAEADEKYGCDKPDTRYDLLLHDVTEAVRGCGFRVFAGAIEEGGVVKACRVDKADKISNSR